MVMIAFQLDRMETELDGSIETALFMGVRGEPSLESTQLRWQVRASTNDIVELETGPTHLQRLGGALFLTTRQPRDETAPGETSKPFGWMRWIADDGRRSFQIQLAISAMGFNRVCDLAQKGRYPDAILTFQDQGPIDFRNSAEGDKKMWKNMESKLAFISEYTLRYDLSISEGTG
jgi:hypothetical protein